MDKADTVFLHAPARTTFVPLVNSFVQNGALAFDLGKAEALALTLAAEEIFAYLCQSAMPDRMVDISCTSRGYSVRVTLEFVAREFNLNAFNLTSTVSLDTESGLAELGLVLASRSVDHFQVSRTAEHGLRLTLLKEKTYPGITAEPLPLPHSFRLATVRAPHPEEIKRLAQFTNQVYPAPQLPAFLHYPGKVVDMIGAGEYQAAIAVGAKGELGGALLWRWAGQKTVECFGPYVFGHPPQGIANALLENCLGAVAKTSAVCLVNRLPTPDLPLEHFELLGTLTGFHPDGSSYERATYLRHLQEDEGGMMWAHPDLAAFLRQEYVRHVLPRDIAIVKDEQETHPAFSVLSSEIDHLQDHVTLRPIWVGKNIKENLDAHIALFQREKLPNLFFEMDLGQAWQTEFTPALLDCGFGPRLILPYGGKGDLVIFQWRAPVA